MLQLKNRDALKNKNNIMYYTTNVSTVIMRTLDNFKRFPQIKSHGLSFLGIF